MRAEPAVANLRDPAARPGAVGESFVTVLGEHRAAERVVRWHFGAATIHPAPARAA